MQSRPVLSGTLTDPTLLTFPLALLAGLHGRVSELLTQEDSPSARARLADVERAILLRGGTFDPQELGAQYPAVQLWQDLTGSIPLTGDGVTWWADPAGPPRTAPALAEWLGRCLDADPAFVRERGAVPPGAVRLSPRHAWLRRELERSACGLAADVRPLLHGAERAALTGRFRRLHEQRMCALLAADPQRPGYGALLEQARDTDVLRWAAERGYLALRWPRGAPLWPEPGAR